MMIRIMILILISNLSIFLLVEKCNKKQEA